MGGPTFAGFNEQQGALLLRGPFGAPYSLNPRCSSTFKFACGEFVIPRKRADAGRTAVVLGTLNDTLWVHYLDGTHAVPLKFCTNFVELMEQYDLEATQPPRGCVPAQTALGVTFHVRTANLFDVFGFRPNERLYIGTNKQNCTVIGELFGVLWVSLDSQAPLVTPLIGATSEDSLRSLYNVCEEFDPRQSHGVALTPTPSPRRTPRSASAAPFVVDEQRRVAVCAQPFGKVEVDVSNQVLREAFSVMHGQRLTARRGAIAGTVSTVVGVRGGNLYVLTDGEKYVTCCRNCSNAADLHEVYGFEISTSASGKALGASAKETPKKASVDGTPTARPLLATPGSAVNEGSATTPRPRTGTSAQLDSEMASPTTVQPPAHFQCWTAFGRLDFDPSEAACRRFGLYHQQTVKASLGPDSGSKFHVVGERMGTLWVVPDGSGRAIPLTHCHNADDIKSRFGFVVVGKQNLMPLSQQRDEPPPTPVVSPRGSRSSRVPAEPSLSPSPDRQLPSDAITASVTRLSQQAAPRSSSGPVAATSVPSLDLGFARGAPAAPSPAPAVPPLPQEPQVDRATEEQWEHGRMPATRHYLKAVALLRTGAPSEAAAPMAFHSYYLSNSSARLSQALQQLSAFRVAWEEERRAGGAPCAFSNATVAEMLSVMRARREVFA